MSAALVPSPDDGADLIGQYRRFGDIGPVYEVTAAAKPGIMRICLVESGEEVEYPVSEVRLDPQA